MLEAKAHKIVEAAEAQAEAAQRIKSEGAQLESELAAAREKMGALEGRLRHVRAPAPVSVRCYGFLRLA